MKALVVGGTGPTGPHIVEGLLDRRYEVAIFHTGLHEVEFTRPVEHIHGEARSAQDIEEKLGKRKFDVTVCTYGRLRVVAGVMRGKTDRFIGITGPPQYLGFRDPKHNPEPMVIPISEDAPKYIKPEPYLFGYLVGLGEKAVMEAHQAGDYIGTTFRYPRIYGPRQIGPTEWLIVRRILDGRKRLILADGGLRFMDRCGARNAAHAVLLGVDKPKVSGGQGYNCQDDWIPTVGQWVDLISQLMEHQWQEIVSLPFALAKPAWRFMREQGHHTWLDNSKLKRELGYKDVMPPKDGIREMVEWLLELKRTNPGRLQEMEKSMGEPFDYAAEDRIIEAYHKLTAAVEAVNYPLEERGAYGYAHGQATVRE